MIIRIYELTAKFGQETIDYHDYKCNTYQVYNGILHLMRTGIDDLFVPLTSIKLFQQISQEPVGPQKLTDSMIDEVLDENSSLLQTLADKELL